ncbi:hypothetical protein Pint_15103 [Pistacia integerrima]|uniref:Uncharacterized protein n=1 Tax=Pistacia integerrima TaxID=434235 RepID=A0ACC0ZD25_9ROSI|nr:hypothetical protein Pint_15103 [Pistacia integerrima]
MLTSQISPSISSHFCGLQVYPQKQRSKEPRKCTSRVQTVALRENVDYDSTAIDSVSAVDALTSCTSSRNIELGFCLHALVLKSGLNDNVFVNNSLLNMYTKCKNIEDAARLFDHMPERTIVSWTSMISGYCQNGAADKAITLFCEMLKHVYPNEFTLAALLQACAKKDDSVLVRCIHCIMVKLGLVSDNFLRNSLIDAYAKSGLLLCAEKLLERFSCQDVVSWTSVISGYVFNGMMDEALVIFIRMQGAGTLPNEWVHGLVIKLGMSSNDLIVNSLVEIPETMASLLQQCGMKLGKEIHGYLIKHDFFPCIVIENSLIDMYAEIGESESAYQLFARMNNRDMVFLEYHDDMPCEECVNPSLFKLSIIAARPGKLDLAEKIFKEMLVKDLGSWNSLITAYGSAAKVRAEMRGLKGMGKEGGWSSVEVGGNRKLKRDMDPDSVKSTLSNLAFGNVIAAAARDYQKEILAQEKARASASANEEVDLDELMDDPELEKLHADRIAALKKEAEKRQVLQMKGHGEYREIGEGDFLGEVTGSEKVICHFYHKEFYRCK